MVAGAPPFPEQATLYDHIRKAPVRKREVGGKEAGNVDEAFKTAAKVIEAEYEWPFQSHACMGPACATVAIKDGEVTCWTGSQKPHFVQNGIAGTLGIPADKVRAIWVTGPGSYGRSDADDAAMDAAVMARAVGRPVRVQYMREQGTGWDPKGPASTHKARAAVDASGKVTAYEFTSKGFSRVDVNTNGSQPHDTLAGQLRDVALKSGDGFGVPAESYEFDNKRMAWETIPPLLDRASPLRSAHLRDPVGPQIHFASESFIDEVAAAVGADPIEFRLRHIKEPRDVAVIKAAAEKAKWDTRPSPRRDQTGNKVSGRGIAYSQRNGTRVAVIAEVDIDRSTGKIWARKFTVAHDCGQIINPDGLVKCIEGNIVQGVSRTLWEEVTFDRKTVTSVDWISYPILDITETPGEVDVVLINHPELPPTGAGEPSIRPVAAAIANAIFDATGVRIRRVPFSPERVKAALSSLSGSKAALSWKIRRTRDAENLHAASRAIVSRAAVMMSGTAASLPGAMMWTPATCGMSASSRTMSMQMRRPSAAGSAARSMRSTIASGMMAPNSFSLIQRADLAERSGTMPMMSDSLPAMPCSASRAM